MKNKLDLQIEEDVDRQMIKECITNYGFIDYKDLVCLDLGANVGGFTKIALDSGAKQVTAVECDGRNYNLLCSSFFDNANVELIHGAISNSFDDFIKLYKSNSKNKHCATSIKKKTHNYHDYDEVPNINCREFLNDAQDYDVIKCDIEGAEWDIMDTLLDYNSNKILFLELHVNSKTQPLFDEYLPKLKLQYPSFKIEPIVVFGSIIAYDCYFERVV